MAQMVLLTLVEKIERTPTIVSFRFIPSQSVSFLPGQYLRILFDEQDPNDRTLNKFLSFSSSPAKGYIEVTKRLSDSAFSARLKKLQSNDTVMARLPMGTCTFNEDFTKIGFLVGGIGITPVISIIEHIMEKDLATDVVLFYSNREEDEIAYRAQLDAWHEKNPRLRVIYTVSDCAPQDQRCVPGVITKELVLANDLGWEGRTWFMYGPPQMVEAMNALCVDSGCRQEAIKQETFVGY